MSRYDPLTPATPLSGERELARRVVKCKGWRWVPGMLLLHPSWSQFRISTVGLTGVRGVCSHSSPMGGAEWAILALPLPLSDDILPDLDDPATLGCLLALVREAWGEPRLVVVWWGACWGIELDDRDFCASIEARAIRHAGKRCCIGGPCEHPATGATEAEALAVALEATP